MNTKFPQQYLLNHTPLFIEQSCTPDARLFHFNIYTRVYFWALYFISLADVCSYANAMLFCYHQSVQSLSPVRLFATPWTAAHQASLPITNSWSLLDLMSIDCEMPSNHLILSSPSPAFNLSQHQGLFQSQANVHRLCDAIQPSHPLLSPSHPAFIFPSIRVFSNESALCSGASASASVLPLNIQDSISFRIDWFDLLAVQGTLKSLQHHSSKAAVLWCSAFFMVQLFDTVRFVCVKSLSCVLLSANPWTVRGLLHARIQEWVAISFSS